MQSRVTLPVSRLTRYLRLIYRLIVTLPLHLTLGFWLMFMRSHCNYAVLCSLWRAQCFVVHVRCRRKESSRSLCHLLMSFLYECGLYNLAENWFWG